jgi:hypothetical protein
MAFVSCNMALYLKMETADISETLVRTCIYKIIRCLMAEVCNVNNNNCRGNLKSQEKRIRTSQVRVLNARFDGHKRSNAHNVHTFRNESVEVTYGLERVELNEALC